MKHLTLEELLAAFCLDPNDPRSLFELPALLIPPVAGEDPRRLGAHRGRGVLDEGCHVNLQGQRP